MSKNVKQSVKMYKRKIKMKKIYGFNVTLSPVVTFI